MDEDRKDGEDPSGDPEETPPLQDLVDRIRENEPGVHSAEGSGSDLVEGDIDTGFTREDATPIDVDSVWESIESNQSIEGISNGEVEGEEEHVVDKKWYCEQCEYFSDPPAVHCTHDGTSIVEFVGTEKVLVRNCPIVAERQALGQFQGDEA